jgi:1-acyl-sn-glycerol-3-phosphate acyltransferase
LWTGSQRFYEAHRVPLRLLFSLLLRVRARDLQRLPRTGGVVLVCNHLTDLDPLLLATLLPRQLHFMAKEELFRFKPLGWWLRQTGTFPVRRGEVDRAALRHAEALLRAGHAVMVFPEGHRSATAQLQEARAGAVLLASRTGCPILPLAIAGTEHLSWKGQTGRSGLRRLHRPLVRIRAGELIHVDATSKGRGRKEAADGVMRQIVSLLPPAYHGVYARQ